MLVTAYPWKWLQIAVLGWGRMGLKALDTMLWDAKDEVLGVSSANRRLTHSRRPPAPDSPGFFVKVRRMLRKSEPRKRGLRIEADFLADPYRACAAFRGRADVLGPDLNAW